MAKRQRKSVAQEQTASQGIQSLYDMENGYRYRQRIRELEAELSEARLTAAQHLLKYGWHDDECEFMQDTHACTCGLDALVRDALHISNYAANKGEEG